MCVGFVFTFFVLWAHSLHLMHNRYESILCVRALECGGLCLCVGMHTGPWAFCYTHNTIGRGRVSFSQKTRDMQCVVFVGTGLWAHSLHLMHNRHESILCVRALECGGLCLCVGMHTRPWAFCNTHNTIGRGRISFPQKT